MDEFDETTTSQTNEYRGGPAKEIFNEPLPDMNVLLQTFIRVLTINHEEIRLTHGLNASIVIDNTATNIIQQSQLPQCYKANMIKVSEMAYEIGELKDEYEHSANKTAALNRIMSLSLDIAKEAINCMAPEISSNITYSLSYQVAHTPDTQMAPEINQ